MNPPAREAWLDFARGLAVLLMVVAHAAPAGFWPWVIAALVTAPLFVMVLGASRTFAWQRWTSARWAYVASEWVRGLALLGAGVLLVPVHSQVWVVLGWLGVLVILLAPFTGWLAKHWKTTLCLAAALAVAAAPLMDWARGSGGWVQFVFAHPAYRMPAFIAYALVGIALAEPFRAMSGRLAVIITFAFGAASVGVVLLGYATSLGAQPNSGQAGEVWASLLLAVSALAACRALTRLIEWSRHRRWTVLLSTMARALRGVGEMAFTAYALHLVALRVGSGFTATGRDNDWGVMLGTIGLLLAVCWVWRSLGWPGPLELAMRIVTRPWRRVGSRVFREERAKCIEGRSR